MDGAKRTYQFVFQAADIGNQSQGRAALSGGLISLFHYAYYENWRISVRSYILFVQIVIRGGRQMTDLLKSCFTRFLRDNGPRLAAALSYYTIFSIAPLLLIAVVVVGFVYGEDAAQGLIVQQLEAFMGASAARFLEQLILQAAQPSSSLLATIVGIGFILYGASRIFNHLRFSLNAIWDIKDKPGLGILHTLKIKGIALMLVLFTGLILLGTIVFNTVIVRIVLYFEQLLVPLPYLWYTINFFILYVVTTVVFALIFKYIPSAKISWNPVWVGALFTALLFSLGRILLGIYLSLVSPASTYGAAGSLVVILFWIYFSAQILFLGGEFTQAYAAKRGTPIEPSKDAIVVPPEKKTGI